MEKGTWYVYSSLLGGFIATGLQSKHAAETWISEYHDKREARGMTVGQF